MKEYACKYCGMTFSEGRALGRHINHNHGDDHGQTGTRLYRIWQSMKNRCYRPQQDSYKYYGAKGIKVCSEWHKFLSFYEWALANGYTENLTIDRKDSEGDYEPANCRWVTMRAQNRRHKNCLSITYKGRTQLAIDWAREFGIKLPTFYWRLHHGYSMEKIESGREVAL